MRPFILYAGIALLLTMGCQNRWKQTGPMTIEIGIAAEDMSNSYLSLTGGWLKLERFKFEGNRIQSVDVYFEDDFESERHIDLTPTGASSFLSYDIPQGTYTEIKAEIRFEADDSDDPTFLLEGTFDDGQNLIPVRFESTAEYRAELIGKFENGGQELSWVAEEGGEALILLKPINWFDSVSPALLSNASRTLIDGVSTILINEDTNETLYGLILNHIASNAEFKL